ncbi:hypothetical protein FQN51_001653 [Onygenales sp. PD_10]|nr:hypothetical protein FQN51_001653 [Onygenales sp. PD_10]
MISQAGHKRLHDIEHDDGRETKRTAVSEIPCSGNTAVCHTQNQEEFYRCSLHDSNSLDEDMLDVAEAEISISPEGVQSQPSYEPILGDQEICFGALYDAGVAFKKNLNLDEAQFKQTAKSSTAFETFPVVSRGTWYALGSSVGRDFAILDTATTMTLQSLEDLESPRFQAVTQRQTDAKRRSNIIEISVNIYGRMKHIWEVGLRLRGMKRHLQHPDRIDPGLEYDNPHFLKLPGESIDLKQFIKPRDNANLTKQTMASDVDRVLDGLNFVVEGVDLPSTESLRTSLLSHQEAGVKFIRHKEDLQENLGLWISDHEAGIQRYYHQISGSVQSDRPCVSLGGIIADEMGVGKTFTMLAVISLSLNEARQFALYSQQQQTKNSTSAHATRATLVVVPSAQLIDVWLGEMERHIEQGAVKVLVFHDKGRSSDPMDYCHTDVVLTTYATLAADHRVKAHWIRNESTKQFRAVNSLDAQRRWCLTGTPIQNRLEDIAALVHYLKIEPFAGASSRKNFANYIIQPFFSAAEDGSSRNLRILLQSLCLRRTSQTGASTVRVQTRLVSLMLTCEEKIHYDHILASAKTEIDAVVSSKSSVQKFTRLFVALNRLRMLCNHGTFQRPLRLTPSRPSSPLESPSGFDLTCDLCQQEEYLNLMSSSPFCWSCSRPLCKAQTPREVSDRGQNYLSPTPVHADSPILSPVSLSPLRLSSVPGDGFSTKLSSVVEHLKDDYHNSKSIVFSCWTTTLDHLSNLLAEQGMSFVKIDGQVKNSERLALLKLFRESPDTPVLLMTYGTGAVGLTLTAASRIHIVEPQYNPFVEDQAIGRAVRLGQTRDVTVYRYVVENTIEKNVFELQRKKKMIAKFTIDRDGDSLSEKMQELRGLLDTNVSSEE